MQSMTYRHELNVRVLLSQIDLEFLLWQSWIRWPKGGHGWEDHDPCDNIQHEDYGPDNHDVLQLPFG